MDSNDRVDTLNILRSSFRIVAVKIGMSGLVDCFAAINDLPEGWRQLLVS